MLSSNPLLRTTGRNPAAVLFLREVVSSRELNILRMYVCMSDFIVVSFPISSAVKYSASCRNEGVLCDATHPQISTCDFVCS